MKIYISWPGKHKSLIGLSEVAGINRSNVVKTKHIGESKMLTFVDGKEKRDPITERAIVWILDGLQMHNLEPWNEKGRR